LGYLTVGRGQNQEWDLKTLVQQSHSNFGEAAQ
jgi:hypothetical protein